MHTSKSDNKLIALWLFASLVVAIPALNLLTAAFFNGEYIPVGNDSFYHARRIIDAATSERGFYQFDDMIHAPEGSWLVWPWAYDYVMSLALRVALWISPETKPMAFLAYVPVFWILVNTALMTLIGRSLKLPIALIAVVLLGFALTPLTQLLHGVGAIDHHFMELTFVLLTTWSALRFYETPGSRSAAIQLGVAMGIAPAAHNSLFIVQIPIMLAALVFWLRGQKDVFAQAHAAAIALVASTLLIVLPSGPFREMFFEFATLSWFHLYVAICSGAAFVLMQRLELSNRNIGVLLGTLVLIGLPLLFPFFSGANYLAGGQVGLPTITEVASPWQQMSRAGSHIGATRYYGFLIFLAPLVLAAFAWLAYRSRDAVETFFGIAGVFGLILLMTQFRFHPFGFWALLLGGVYFAHRVGEATQAKTSIVAVASALVLVIAMQPALQHQLFERYLPSLSREYAVVSSIYPEFADACREQPGVVLNSPDDGHPVRYHTDCGVITNNFLLTPQQGEKLILASALMQMSPEELPAYAPFVRYVFVHLYGIYTTSESGPIPTPLEELKATNSPLFYALAVENRAPDNYELVAELRVEDERDIPYAQVWRINPAETATPP